MKIPICDTCKAKNVEGVICRHCDNYYCYECLDLHKSNLRPCPICGEFICNECYDGMVECDNVRKK